MQEQLSDGPGGRIAPSSEDDTTRDVDAPEPGDEASDRGRQRRRRRSRRTDWRLGGTAVRTWDGTLLATAFISLGVGVVASTMVGALWRSPWSALVSLAVLWVGMLVPVVVAFRRGRPAGLLRFRPVDLLYGLVLGVALRLVEGWASGAASKPLPSVATLDGALSPTWLFTDALPAAVFAPAIEEFFFRAVVLIAVFSILRRAAGTFAAALAAVLVSTATFILLHGVDGSLPLSEAIPLGVVGIVTALLVVLTGRIWGALLVHAVYNALMIALIAAGTLLR
ncbi:CPBP family glutamic-type intramembrane protease [Microbacterium dauci]|uniref:CPBP family glutamic-type intramembrane protease n=1 Tax=Microbacterium dauci TaxID=3048008 RepID=A0ABT6ZEC7_9MICO|nr:CPBP family glutamic-type intramembrane protease [Microbacterium sp. LX3-4]MDJ1114519.1 CPBP family glutamic-type intramembrane protease [Microbacterium sp. LX3-4]